MGKQEILSGIVKHRLDTLTIPQRRLHSLFVWANQAIIMLSQPSF